jgi:hypothetical protein
VERENEEDKTVEKEREREKEHVEDSLKLSNVIKVCH